MRWMRYRDGRMHARNRRIDRDRAWQGGSADGRESHRSVYPDPGHKGFLDRDRGPPIPVRWRQGRVRESSRPPRAAGKTNRPDATARHKPVPGLPARRVSMTGCVVALRRIRSHVWAADREPERMLRLPHRIAPESRGPDRAGSIRARQVQDHEDWALPPGENLLHPPDPPVARHSRRGAAAFGA